MITWTITTLDREVSNGFVTTAHWTATAVDGDYTTSIYSTCSWAEGTPTIPYASLTEAEVLNWVWSDGVIRPQPRLLWRLRLNYKRTL